LILPGCERASAISSFTELAGKDGCATSALGALAISVTGAKSRTVSYGTLPIRGLMMRLPGPTESSV
jgi:hypothetical protein